MDNKLSKPVAYSLRFMNMYTGEPDKNINVNTTFSTLEKAKAYGLGSRYVTQDDGKIVSVRDASQDPIVEPLYSQEYVSALLQKIAELGQAMRHIHGAALERLLDGVTPDAIAGGWTAQANDRLRKPRRKKKSLPVIVPKSVYLVIYEQCEGFVEVNADPQVIWDACRAALEEVQIDE